MGWILEFQMVVTVFRPLQWEINFYEKKAQKNLKKKKISETINNAIPQRKPNSVIEVWRPWIAPSREISRHHCVITNPNNIRPIENK